jgi:hypothetical protein
MAGESEGIRPAVISSSSVEYLDELRRFRHLVRNVYTDHLDATRMADLVEALPGAWADIRSDLQGFIEFLEGVSMAEDQ